MAYYDKFEHGERRFSGSRSQGGMGRDEQFRRERGERFRGEEEDAPRRYGERRGDDVPRRYGERREEDAPRRYGERREEDAPRRYGERREEDAPRRYGERREEDAPRRYGERPQEPRGGYGAPRTKAPSRPVPPAVHDDEPPIRPLPPRTFAPSSRPLPAPVEPELPENLLVGRNPIREAIKAGRDIEKLLVMRGDLSGSAREIVAKAREARIVVQEVDKSRLDAIYPNHQGMLAYVSAANYSSLEEIFTVASERGEQPFVIVLDGITDPHNLGAIIRTAECVGAHGVIIPERRSAGLTPAAVKAAAGATEYIRIAKVINLNRTLEELKERGLWVIGAAMDGEDAFQADLTGATALVIGAEGEGISPLVLKKCDRVLSLPMKGHLDSLNASVAAGVMMYAIMNARRF